MAKNSLPPVPKANYKDRGQQRQADALQSMAEVLAGRKGNGLDRAVLVRDLVNMGVATVTVGAGGSVIIKPGGGGGGGQDPDEEIPPLTPPPAPKGFTATGAFTTISLYWDKPAYKPASPAAHTEIWRHSENVLANATMIATTAAHVYGDTVGTGSAYYYWIRHVNVGSEGNTLKGPYNGANGLFAETSNDVGDVIVDLTEQMRESPLIQDLQTDISDGDALTNAALADAETALNDAIARVEKEYKAADVTANAQIKDLEQVVADENESIVRQLSQIRTDFTTADRQLSGSITNMNTVLTNADNALAQSLEGLEAEVVAGDNELKGSINSLKQTLVSADSALSDRIDTTQSTLNGVSATVQGHSQTIAKINEDGSTAYQAMWTQKAQAGDIKAGIGLVAKSDGTSQCAVSASQFFVFDPNAPGELVPTFAIDKGQVVIPKALIENATIQILNAQVITADKVVAGIEIRTPKLFSASIESATIRGTSDAGFGAGGPYNGYNTFINGSGRIDTKYLYAHGGQLNNITINDTCTIRGTLDGVDGNFTGTVQANKIVGDIVSVKGMRLVFETNTDYTYREYARVTWRANAAGVRRNLIISTFQLSGRCRIKVNGTIIQTAENPNYMQTIAGGATVDVGTGSGVLTIESAGVSGTSGIVASSCNSPLTLTLAATGGDFD